VQLALNVENLDEAVVFYSALFRTSPAKIKPGYANFSLDAPALKLVLIEKPGHGGTLNHLGVEVRDSDTVRAEIARLTNEGLITDAEIGTTCCLATQDKVWVTARQESAGRSTPSSPTARPSASAPANQATPPPRPAPPAAATTPQSRPAARRPEPRTPDGVKHSDSATGRAAICVGSRFESKSRTS